MTFKFKEEKTNTFSILILSLILVLVIVPLLSFWVGYFVGWLSKLIIGKYLVEGFALLNINLPLDKIPLIGGCIAWIAGFFMQPKQNS